jgi:opacity protein-like surface antigen
MQSKQTTIGAAGILCGGLALAAASVASRADDLAGLYLGGNFARTKISYDTSAYEAQLMTEAGNGLQTLTFTNAALADRSSAWWADVGYMRWAHVGIEASYLHLGELTYYSSGTLTPPTQGLTATTAVKSRGPALALVLRLPLAESFDVNLRLGDYYGRTTLANGYALSGTYTVTPQSKSTSSLLAGIGAAYTVAGHWSVHLDYLRVDQAGDSSTVGKYNVSVASAGLSYTF